MDLHNLFLGGLAQMVERALCMCEVAGLIPASSNLFSLFVFKFSFILVGSFTIEKKFISINSQL